jgi:hypothetical protein
MPVFFLPEDEAIADASNEERFWSAREARAQTKIGAGGCLQGMEHRGKRERKKRATKKGEMPSN